MAIEAVKQFSAKVDTDKTLQSSLDAIPKTSTRDNATAQIVKIAAGAGFQFTPEEYTRFVGEEMARKEEAKKFIRKANQDPKLQAKLQAISASASWENTINEVVKIADDAGFKFAARDYDGALNEMQTTTDSDAELSEEELEAVAGGASALMNQPAALKSMAATKYYYYYYAR